jgi:predicted amidophosphoribosyltransferase
MTTMNLSSTVCDAVRDAAAILLSVRCAGCAVPDRAVCATCLRALSAVPQRQVTAGLPVWVALEYSGVARAVLLAYKDAGRMDAAGSLARALRPALAAAQIEVRSRRPASSSRTAADRAVVPLLPVLIPSTRESRRRRGYHPTGLVLSRARVLVPPLWRALRLTRETADQAGLSGAARAANRDGSMVGSPRLRGRDCLLVDDIVTTGSTLAEAARAVRAAGGRAVGAATIARTPLHRV